MVSSGAPGNGPQAASWRPYQLLLHDTVRAHLVSLGRRARRRLREKLDFLKDGMWAGGLRVKKLHGSRCSVFEARLSDSDRILFTLGRPLAENGAATRIYVWGVEKHDAVTAATRRIVPANAPFLDFQPDAIEELPEEGFVDDLDEGDFSPALDRPTAAPDPDAPSDAGPQRWLVVDDEEWRRLQTAHSADHVELYLYLTREQARLLHSEPPLLLSGTAGSGKTTIAVYFLLRHRVRQLTAAEVPVVSTGASATGERALFLTCSPHLKRLSERIYRGLVRATDRERAPQAVRFATFGELLAEIVGLGGGERWQAPPAGLAEFHAIFGNLPRAGRHDPELVWEEIRAIIKGAKPPVSRRRFGELAARYQAAEATQRARGELAEYVVRLANLELGAKLDAVRARKSSFADLTEFAASLRNGAADRQEEQGFLLASALRLLERQATRLDQPLLTLREYESLGKKRAPNFPVDRREIYRIAEYYQQQLEADARYDEIDLTRKALEYLEQHGDQFRYDLVVCDEVQDFTDVQLALLFRLATDPRRTVLTGDPKQIINPSGFRWEEVRTRYYERGLQVPEVINLSINFRSVGNIVSLANKLLELKGNLVGLGGGEIAERWTFRGRPPLLVEGLPERDLLGTVRLGGAGRVVLVRTVRERDRLRTALQTEFVFTINEAKGLEFDAVLLWRFSAAEGAPAIWRRIANDQVRGGADTPHIRHELNLLSAHPSRTEPAVRGGDAGAQHAGDLGRRAGRSDLEHRHSGRSGISVGRRQRLRDHLAARFHACRVGSAGRLLCRAGALRRRRRVLLPRAGGRKGGAGARPPAGAGGGSSRGRRSVRPPRACGAGRREPGTRRGVPGSRTRLAARRQRGARRRRRGAPLRDVRRLRLRGQALAAARRTGWGAAQLGTRPRVRETGAVPLGAPRTRRGGALPEAGG